jgi:hypothetical protein
MHRTKLLTTALLALLILGTALPISAEKLNGVEILSTTWRGQQIEYLDREILMMLKPEKSQAIFERDIKNMPVEIVRDADKWGFMKLKVNEGQDLFKLIDQVEKMPGVRYAEPNMVDHLLVIPNDPLFNTQWHYNNTGQSPPGGTPDADIDAPEGWDISTGSDTIMVGVLDSGIPIQGGVLSHPDLDDPNRFFMGKDIVNNDFEPVDDNGHGTHVSGTIGAESNNGIGVAGVAWNVKIMAIKVFSSSGSGSHEYFRDGCIYGVDNGCKVLNYSGGGSSGATKEHGVAYADSNDVVLCAAAGNNNHGSVDWPGAYSLQYSNVICVASTNTVDGSSSFSSIGPEVTISAPGGTGSPFDSDDIQSTFPNYPCYLTTNYGLPQNYGPLAGTSMATPHAAGFAALILSMNPGLTPDSVRQIMINTADDLGTPGFDNYFGWGRINVFNALSQMGSIIITHTPLPDTRDSLNDYEVIAKIWSVSDLVADSLLLEYEINSTWYEDTFTATGGVDEYHAYIPAQSPGTTINYYIFAQNVDGDADTTDTYTFSVLDYDIILSPSDSSIVAPAYDTAWYLMEITNNGIYEDQYSLAFSGNNWETSLWDDLQMSEITGTPILQTDESMAFYARVIVPSSLEAEYDTVDVQASSINQPGVTANSILKTISAGEPWEIPFTDNFVTTTFDITKWESTDGAEINSVGLDEPTPPYSVDLNGDPGGDDQIITEMINLKDESNVVVKYQYEQTGGGESPDANDDLIIEYLDIDSNWVELNRHLGSDPDMTAFEEVEIPLPPEAMHAGFRLSIRCTATSGSYDDWFVDDLYVGHPSDYDVSINPSFQSQYGPAGDYAVYSITVMNKGFLQDNFDLTSSGDWDVTFYDETGLNEVTSTGAIPGGDSIYIVAKVTVPPGTPLHYTNTSTIYATSQGDNNIAAYGMLETISAGTPAPVPWYETFPDDTLQTQKWFTFIGGQISSTAPGTPTAPYSYNLDGGRDTAVTQLIDLSGMSDVLLSFYYEMGGYEDLPEAGDNLWVDYRNSSGVWTNLAVYEGGGTAMTEFEYVNLVLPPDANHSSLQIRFRTFGSDAGEDDWFIDNIRLDQSPSISATPTSMNESLIVGDSSDGEMIIMNDGPGGLLYNIRIQPHLNLGGVMAKILGEGPVAPASKDYPPEVYADVEKGTDIDYQGAAVEEAKGGPDDYGYYWIDSDDPGGPAFDWVDVSSVGTEVTGQLDDDNYIGPFDLGFEFAFYGGLYDQFYIGSNGIVGFMEDGMGSRTARPIPTATVPNSLLALLWDDLDPTDYDNPGAHVYYHSNGDRCVIQFVDYPEYRADPGDVVDMEVIIYKDGRIRYQYGTIGTGFDLSYCTVGIENQNGTDGLEIVYHASYLHSNLAIEIFKPFDWMVMDQMSGELYAGEADTIGCQFVTDENLEPGMYTSDIVIESNDPDNSNLTIQAQLDVIAELQYTCGDADADGSVNVSDAVYIINFVFVEGPEPNPVQAADVNCDQEVNVSDAVYIINYIFAGGNEPCANCP